MPKATPKHLRRVPPEVTYWCLVLGVALTLFGVFHGGISVFKGFWHRNHVVSAQAIPSNKPKPTAAPLIAGIPNHIALPSVQIDLTVIPGYYNSADKSWTLTDTQAQWGSLTAQANNKGGLAYIYAHDRVNVFYNLPQVQPGDEAIVTTTNGHTFTYTYVSSVEVDPSDTSLFSYTGKPILVLQTCSGAWYQYRTLYTFDLVSAV